MVLGWVPGILGDIPFLQIGLPAVLSVYFDVLKAVAIISVVLYHLGICEFGYLGVDVFLVIAGYFTTKSVDKQIIGGGRYLPFVANRFFRLLPLLMLAGIVCLLFGLFFMLPDDYENVAQSVVATNLFANNILQSITTKNYWATVNEYKPLMHTWYVGLLMQFYITIPLVLFVIGKYKKDKRRNLVTGEVEDVKGTSVKELQSVFDTFYHPSNMCLVLVGNFDLEHVLNLIKEDQNNKTFRDFVVIKRRYPEELNTINQKKLIKNYELQIPKISVNLKIPTLTLYNAFFLIHS